MMIQVKIGNNTHRKTAVLDDTCTLRHAYEENGVDYSTGVSSLDGMSLRPGDLDKTFKDFGVTEKCYLMSVVKADNA